MLINSDDIKIAKEHLEVMQAFIDGKEIEFKQDSRKGIWRQTTTPTWDFCDYKYRIKPSEPEYVYPIYKRLKTNPKTIVKFTSIDSGIYISTEAQSIYKPGDISKNIRSHTSNSWEDYTVSEDAEKIILGKSNTEELFEVMVYCDIMKEFEFIKQLYKDEDLENKKHLQKTGRSFIIDKDTNQIIKVNYN